MGACLREHFNVCTRNVVLVSVEWACVKGVDYTNFTFALIVKTESQTRHAAGTEWHKLQHTVDTQQFQCVRGDSHSPFNVHTGTFLSKLQ